MINYSFNNHDITILVVDDTPANLKILFAYLRQLNFRVLIAEDGEDALSKVEYSLPDLILLDIMMPKMDGFATCKQLKANQNTANIPVIFVSALNDTVDKIAGFKLGAVDYINKPFECEEVLARISVHLELCHVQRQLKQKNQELNDFSHTVAHDLKNPLNAIKGFSELLEDCYCSPETSEQRKYVHMLQQANQQAFNIIDELLLLAGIDWQKVVFKPIDMQAVVENSLQTLFYMQHQYAAEIQIKTKTWPRIVSHAPWIQAIWVNYLSNAIKYGGRPAKIELGAEATADGQVIFWVKDNGKGLSPAQQQQLFIPFNRMSLRRVDGHGLGLSIVQRIVEKCHGTVGVSSQPDHGSTFYFRLPQATPEHYLE